MGTTYNITVVGEDTLDPTLITDVLEDIENTMSTYRSNSELMRLNTAPINTWLEVSQALYEVLLLSEDVSLLSNGAFDITVAPLVDLWGFGPNKNNFAPPPREDEIEAAKDIVGFQSLVIAKDRPAIFKSKSINLDLSAIAKGYAVDEIAVLLETNNITNYLVEIGGEISSRGRNPQGELWQIAIETPERLATNRSSMRIIEISDLSIASSGDYRNYYEIDGEYFSHTIDSRSGHPVKHNLRSVTVVADNTALADALATAFNVMGLEQATLLANNNNIPVYFISLTEDGYSESYSTAFTPFITDKN
ncbi:MAG: FAD:protein FMN transferase [Gammaproteobacteria bacterium]|nr:FAD:protein FMN transferase [Gammaproteobacteria bacterium]